MRKWFKVSGSQLGLAGLALGTFLLLAVLVFSATPAEAAPQFQGEPPTDETCLACHQQEGMNAQIGGRLFPLRSIPGHSKSLYMERKILPVWIAIRISQASRIPR